MTGQTGIVWIAGFKNSGNSCKGASSGGAHRPSLAPRSDALPQFADIGGFYNFTAYRERFDVGLWDTAAETSRQ